MGKINLLDFEIANLIAAGEVVERPSSVLKELIENSIDSGATKIIAEIKRGGVSLIRVSDNGCGMSEEDLPVAIKRHATSKIKTKEDLDAIGPCQRSYPYAYDTFKRRRFRPSSSALAL